MILSLQLLLLVLIGSCQTDDSGILQNGIKFMKSNGLKYVSLVSYDRNLLEENYQVAWKSAMNESLYFRYNYSTVSSIDSFLILSTAQEIAENPTPILTFVSNQERKRCLLVILKSENSSSADLISAMSTEAHSQNRNLMFYILVKDQWVSMIKVKNTERTVVSGLNLTPELSVIEREWDLQGITVKSISLTWMPDYGLYGCSENGMNCDTVTGILASIFKSVAARTNITIQHILEPNGNWGMQPISGI